MDQTRKVKIAYSVLVLLLAVLAAEGILLWRHKKADSEKTQTVTVQERVDRPETAKRYTRPIPAPISMSRMKSQGCVADGLLSEYNPDSANFVELINRSNCYYMHRAVETWLMPPDFSQIDYLIGKIEKKDVAYGMFIAEAINRRAHYVNEDTGKEFNFEKMCRKGSDNVWGEWTCKPTFSRKEYRDYVQYISEKAIDEGIQSITFGQIFLQEGGKKNYAPQIVKKIRDYAAKNGRDVVIGAQTNSITDPNYLQLFDYIEGGVGINADGQVEDGPCLSTRGSCWALLWHNDFAGKAKNVLLDLDWTGILSDDLDIFARMTPEKRIQTLSNLYKKFNNGKTGFMMPFFGVLSNDNQGCRGPKKKFYSPDNNYSCKDEDAINAILSGKNSSR